MGRSSWFGIAYEKNQLSGFQGIKFPFRIPRPKLPVTEDPLEKEMAIHSSTLAWKIPWTEEPDRLQFMGSS